MSLFLLFEFEIYVIQLIYNFIKLSVRFLFKFIYFFLFEFNLIQSNEKKKKYFLKN